MAADEIGLRRRVAEEAARAAGDVHLKYRGERLERDVKGTDHTDYATLVDLEAQDAVRKVVARSFPGEPVIGEEDVDTPEDLRALVQSGCWFTDPLDGTLEYVHGTPMFSAIVSYARGGEPLAGAVYFTALGEMFSAARGGGATLNGAPIRTSGIDDLRGAILCMAYRGTAPERVQAFTRALDRVTPHVEAIRLPGAPAISACYVASGRFDIFAPVTRPPSELPPQNRRGAPWETAAFIVLVREAGGAVVGRDGGPPDVLGANIYAATPALIEQYLALTAGE